MFHKRDHYAVLGVTKAATQGQIKAAFRKLARQLHPDANTTDPDAERRFKRVATAYDAVGDPKKRRAYDERFTRGRFAGPGAGGPQRVEMEDAPTYHLDLGHHSDFYQSGDPLSVKEAAVLVQRNPSWLRKSIRLGKLRASRDETGYLLRKRDVERLDRTAPRRRPKAQLTEAQERDQEGASEA